MTLENEFRFLCNWNVQCLASANLFESHPTLSNRLSFINLWPPSSNWRSYQDQTSHRLVASSVPVGCAVISAISCFPWLSLTVSLFVEGTRTLCATSFATSYVGAVLVAVLVIVAFSGGGRVELDEVVGAATIAIVLDFDSRCHPGNDCKDGEGGREMHFEQEMVGESEIWRTDSCGSNVVSFAYLSRETRLI